MSIQEYQLSEKVRGKLNGDFVEVIDNLTEGGATKALSAEQGKVIKAFIDKNAKDILDELSRKATNTTLGNVMVDGTSIVVDANGKISSTATGGNTTVIDDVTTGGRDSAWSAEQGKILNDFVMAETMKLVDIYDGLDSTAQNKVLSALQGKLLKDDIDSLFTNWANETQNAVTALSHKGVTLAPDATMKQVVAGIESISAGMQSKTLNISATNPPKSFRYAGGTTNVSLSYVTINIDALGFDPVSIFVEDINFDGNATSVKTDSETFLSARLVDFNTSTHVGTNKWLELGTNGFPSNGNLDIPVSKIGAYTVTVYGA